MIYNSVIIYYDDDDILIINDLRMIDLLKIINNLKLNKIYFKIEFI